MADRVIVADQNKTAAELLAAASSAYVGLTGNETVAGVKTFTNGIVGDVTGEINAAKLDSNATGVGFYGAVPAAQQVAVANAAGGAIIDIEGRAALNALLARLRTLGLIAT